MSRMANTSDVWWKDAVIYCVDVETFQDSDGDGIGDFAGLTSRIDYLAELGITCLWLMPFYPTPDRDDGYDVTDLFGVDSAARHPWRPRRADPDGRRPRHPRDRRPRRQPHLRQAPVVQGGATQHDQPLPRLLRLARRPAARHLRPGRLPRQGGRIWTKDDATGEWYLHHFYSHQPDLNFANPAVRDEIAKSIGFWLQVGLAGFRVDAVPFLVEDIETAGDDVPGDPHEYLKALRAFLGRRRGDGVLLGEVNLPRPEQRRYFGGSAGDELQMQFDFITMQSVYLSLARAGRPAARPRRSRDAARSTPTAQWATFLRNHDELTLDKLSDAERQEVFAAFGPEPEMQVYGRGLKRRVPPMLGRGSAAHPDGVQPALLPARHADALLRRGDRDGRGPRGRGPDGGALARCSGSPVAPAASPTRRPGGSSSGWCPTATGPTTSTSATRSATPTRCGRSCSG